MIVPTFTPGKKYALDGATLQKLFDAVATNRILPSDQYELQVDPGNGTRLGGIKGTGAGSARLWDLVVVSADPLTLAIESPGMVMQSEDVDDSGEIDVAEIAASFEVASGDYLALEWDATATPPVCTLKKLSTWTGHPYPYLTEEDGEGYLVFQKAMRPLWKIVADSSIPVLMPGRHKRLTADLVAVRLCPDAHFEIANHLSEHPTGKMVDVDRFWPGFGGA